jgi:alpha-1,3-glucan synthase
MHIPTSLIVALAQACYAARVSQDQILYNLNQNESAQDPLAYWGKWDNHSFNPSPTNWRFPFYTFFIDR